MLIKPSLKQAYSYSRFLARIIFKKPSTYVLGVIALIISIILGVVANTVAKDASTFLIISYVNLVINLVLALIYGCLKGLNLFKDLAKEGIDILVFSKSITRRNIFSTKLVFFSLLGVFHTLISYVGLMIFYLSNLKYNNDVNLWFISSFFSVLVTYLIFGLVAILIASKANSKVSLIIPILTFVPLVIGGSVASLYSTSRAETFAQIFNQKLPAGNNDSQTILNAEKFYLANKQDEYFIIPKTVNKTKFDEAQIAFINQAIEDSKQAAKLTQSLSYLLVPFQLIDVFSVNDKDPISVITNKKDKALSTYLNYNDQDSKLSNYQLNPNPNLIKLNTASNDQQNLQYIVPNALKNFSLINNPSINSKQIANKLVDKEIIYARKNADNFDISFKEDDKLLPVQQDVVGELIWPLLHQILSSKVFIEFANKWFKQLDPSISKANLLAAISNSVDDRLEDKLHLLVDDNTIVMNSIRQPQIKSIIEKKLYLTTALIYYIYFYHQNSPILLTLLRNSVVSKNYAPGSYQVNIDGEVYIIGGYSGYETQQRENKQNKVIYRYKLIPSNNYLFGAVDQVYSIKRANQVVIKPLYSLIWVALLTALYIGVYFRYTRRDYK